MKVGEPFTHEGEQYITIRAQALVGDRCIHWAKALGLPYWNGSEWEGDRDWETNIH